jgi:hypothetical protein
VILIVRGRGEIEGRGVEIYKERNGGRVEEREGGRRGWRESEIDCEWKGDIKGKGG